MRILYFSRSYTPHDFRFLTSLAESGNQVFYLQLEAGVNSLESRVLPDTIEMVQWQKQSGKFSYKRVVSYIREFKEIISRIEADIVHAGPLQLCSFIASAAGAMPLVSMSWGSDILIESQRSIFLNWITRFTLGRSIILLVDNLAVKQKAISYGFSSQKIVSFPWGIDLEQFTMAKKDNIRKQLNWKDNFVFLSLRSWEPIYGVDIVVRAFCLALKEEPSLRLILIGDGSQRHLVHDILAENHCIESVYLPGIISQADLPGYYNSADLYISASHSDGSSVSLMEAQASGLPAIVSDIPGNKEWINEGDNGWYFPDGDVLALKNTIIKTYKNQVILPQMQLNSRKIAEEKANWKINFKKLLDGYQKAIRLTKG